MANKNKILHTERSTGKCIILYNSEFGVYVSVCLLCVCVCVCVCGGGGGGGGANNRRGIRGKMLLDQTNP